MLFGKHPFKVGKVSISTKELWHNVKNKDVPFPKEEGFSLIDEVYNFFSKNKSQKKKHFSNEIKDLIKKLLDKNQNTRLGAQNDYQEILSHPAFKNINIESLLAKSIPAP